MLITWFHAALNHRLIQNVSCEHSVGKINVILLLILERVEDLLDVLKVVCCLHLQEWFTVLENYHRLNATISDLIMGNAYAFRVFSQNKVGTSETSAVTKEVATIHKTGDLLQMSFPVILLLFAEVDV